MLMVKTAMKTVVLGGSRQPCLLSFLPDLWRLLMATSPF